MRNWLAIANVTDDDARQRLVSCAQEDSDELRQKFPQCFETDMETDLRTLREVALAEGSSDKNPQDLQLFLGLLGIDSVLLQFRGKAVSKGSTMSERKGASASPLREKFHRCDVKAGDFCDEKNLVLHNSFFDGSSSDTDDVHSILYCLAEDLEKG